MHSGNGDTGDLGQRFLACFVAAMDDAGLPDDTEFRQAMRRYMKAAVDEVMGHPDDPATVPSGLPMPRWSWEGRVG